MSGRDIMGIIIIEKDRLIAALCIICRRTVYIYIAARSCPVATHS